VDPEIVWLNIFVNDASLMKFLYNFDHLIEDLLKSPFCFELYRIGVEILRNSEFSILLKDARVVSKTTKSK
jgi:hypothetical protein